MRKLLQDNLNLKLSEMPQWQNLKKLSNRPRCGAVVPDHLLDKAGISFDFSRQYLNQETLNKLIELAVACGLPKAIDGYFCGDKINYTENRAVLHTALRAPFEKTAALAGEEVASSVEYTLIKMSNIANEIRHSQRLGYTGLPIRNIVNIGIGGSDLGPKMSVSALKAFNDSGLNFRFISDVDPASFNDAVEKLNPSETLFIVSSKSFATKETLLNAKKAMRWLNNKEHIDKHFIAVTAEPQKAKSFGINTILPLWDWVGGRFSLCSAINLILMIAVGADDFYQLLLGAYSMDEHFRNADYHQNLPLLLALLGIWNVNFREIESHCMLIYNSRLKYLMPYLQQLEMESNGKSIDREGHKITYNTCPIIWGGIGNQAQHAYYQLLSQGTHNVAMDFIFDDALSDEISSLNGKKKSRILSNGQHTNDLFHINGNVPINILSIAKLSPYSLGALIALYEHKVFVQGVIWQINSFDQFGVESSKVLSNELSSEYTKLT